MFNILNFGKAKKEPGVISHFMYKYKLAMKCHDGFIPTMVQVEEEEKEAKQLAYIGGGTLIALTVVGGPVVANGLVLAILTSASFGFLIIKMPRWFAHLMIEFDIEVDIAVTVLMLAMYGTSVTGLIASGMTAILVSICLKWNKYLTYQKMLDASPN
jgi:hypothetical protein